MIRLKHAKRIVIKTGSALIADTAGPRMDWLMRFASDISALRTRGQHVLLVSSGAIALGRGALGPERPTRLEQKQAAAALGQPRLMSAMQAAFAPHDIRTAQALLTLEDTETRRRWLNGRATLETLLNAGALPVINENDTVATDEIRYGDNDRLAARVAQMMGADVLVLLSDVDGLYTGDPTTDSEAVHIPVVHAIEDAHRQMATGANQAANLGSGGMVTKLMAAEIAHSAGCATVIARGDVPRPVLGIEANDRCTWILPGTTPGKARAAWLQGHLKPEGVVFVDAGATEALNTGASLLAVGIVAVKGDFARGAAIAVKDADGNLLGKGITAYAADDIRVIAGLQSDAVEEELGYRGRPSVIHRDDMVITHRRLKAKPS